MTRRVPEPDEAAVVMEMYRQLDRGRRIGDITRWVNGQGVRTKRGNPFGRSRVREILTNPWYAGKVRHQGELRDGNHEALMRWEEWQRITAKLDRKDPSSVAKRKGGRPSEVALLSGVLFCAHCGGGIWHRKNGQQRHYVCGRVRHATGACDARKFDAHLAEQAVAEHLSTIFVDFEAWLDNLTRERALQRDGLVRELAALNGHLADLQRDEQLIRKDYVRRLRAGQDAAADVAATELERIGKEREATALALGDLDARLAEWDEQPDADGALDWWNDFSAAVRGEIVNAESIRDANAALRERFAGIYVTCGNTPKTGKATFTTRFDFILKSECGEDATPTKPFWLHLTEAGAQLQGTPPVETDRLTFV